MMAEQGADKPNSFGDAHIRHILVLRNPASTRAKAGLGMVDALRRIAPTVEIVETRAGGRAANFALLRGLADKLGPHTLLAVAAGDGTINIVIEFLLSEPHLHTTARHTPILPLWSGNANDLAHMLNGRPSQRQLFKTVYHGRPVAVRPLECRLVFADGSSATHVAACYASFGASAYAAHQLGQPGKRHHVLDGLPGGRIAKELQSVITSLARSPLIDVTENGQARKMYEHIFLNGSRFAKVKGTRLRLTEPHFYHTVMRRKRIRSLFFHIWELTSPDSARRVAGDQAVFTLNDPVWAQFDGEVLRIPAGTTVTMSLCAHHFYALSTLLAEAQ